MGPAPRTGCCCCRRSPWAWAVRSSGLRCPSRPRATSVRPTPGRGRGCTIHAAGRFGAGLGTDRSTHGVADRGRVHGRRRADAQDIGVSAATVAAQSGESTLGHTVPDFLQGAFSLALGESLLLPGLAAVAADVCLFSQTAGLGAPPPRRAATWPERNPHTGVTGTQHGGDTAGARWSHERLTGSSRPHRPHRGHPLACPDCGQLPEPAQMRRTLALVAAILPVELAVHALIVGLHLPLLLKVLLLTVTATVLAIWVAEPSAARLLRRFLHAPELKRRQEVLNEVRRLLVARAASPCRTGPGRWERVTHGLAVVGAQHPGDPRASARRRIRPRPRRTGPVRPGRAEGGGPGWRPCMGLGARTGPPGRPPRWPSATRRPAA